MTPPSNPQTTAPLRDQRRTHRPIRRRLDRDDVLDVTLHDDELSAETELTVLLMVAANDAAETVPLPQHEVDRLLGVRP